MKPFLRRTNEAHLAPVGWVSEPAGVWAGAAAEVVYDPQRHEIVRLHYAGDCERTVLGDAGYRRVAGDGTQELWARDNVDRARRHLRRPASRLGRQHGLTLGT